MTKEDKSIRRPLIYFLLVLVFLMGVVGWTSYQFGQQSVRNGKNDVQFVRQSDLINKNSQSITNLTKQLETLSNTKPKDGTDGKDGVDSVSHNTLIEKQTIEQVPIKGDSAYQSWLALGNVGTEQEFLNSLKGTDARQIEGCTTGGTIGWRYVGDTICKTNVTNSLKAK